jgi:hypothetical protein
MAAADVTLQRPLFATEAGLVSGFLGALRAGGTAFGDVEIVTEWDHRAGLVDVLVRDVARSLVAFEAKLSNWQRAFRQAYRSTAYANRSYVLLPADVAHRALRRRHDFECRGIGLCSFDGTHLQVLVEAMEQDALLSWLRVRAHAHFDHLNDDKPVRLGRDRNQDRASVRL